MRRSTANTDDIADALDVVGDLWSLLILRELGLGVHHAVPDHGKVLHSSGHDNPNAGHFRRRQARCADAGLLAASNDHANVSRSRSRWPQ
jgi:hypothetical protein